MSSPPGPRRTLLVLATLAIVASGPACAAGAAAASIPWWTWPMLLFFVCLALGIVAVPAGVGGGVLFVPIVGGLFPFHLDFVRGAGLMVALAGAVAASPTLLRLGFASLRVALPLSLMVGASQIAGAMAGLALPAGVVQAALGLVILAIVALMMTARRPELSGAARPDALATALRMHGVFHDAALGAPVEWTVHRTGSALAVFLAIGLLAGMFGLGAGWANVPALSLLMGAPLKVAAGSSSLILAMSSSAAWVYINQGAMLPMIVVPSIIGMMLGARLGVHLLQVVKASAIRRLVIGMLLISGARALLKGVGLF
jgi:hypothetical protein